MRRSGKQGKTLSVLWTAGKSSAGRKELKIQTLTMDLSSLNVDVLLYLIKFVDPVDRFNLVSSGILKGFENVNKGIDLDKRIEGIGIELGLCCDSTCQLEIRSLIDRTCYTKQNEESSMIVLERLADGGYFQNNREVIVNWCWPSVPRFSRFLHPMTNLEKLTLLKWDLTLTEDVPQLFRSCPTLTELHLRLFESQKVEMNEELKNELRSGFQRLQLLELHWFIDSWPLIQEMFTWLKDCAQLTVYHCYWRTSEIDGSLTFNPDLAQNLRFLHMWQFPAEFVKWILPFCPNIHTLKLDLIEQPEDLHNDIVRHKTLKDLHITISDGIHLTEIIRNCQQLEILRVSSCEITLSDLADLEHCEDLKETHLRRLDFSVIQALPRLKRCTNLRRISLGIWKLDTILPPSKELCDFIMELKHLTFLHLIFRENPNCGHFKSEVDQVKAFVLTRRPNFEFYVSCCSKFNERRVKKEFVYF